MMIGFDYLIFVVFVAVRTGPAFFVVVVQLLTTAVVDPGEDKNIFYELAI